VAKRKFLFNLFKKKLIKQPIKGYFLHKAVIIPHDDKIGKGGEDEAKACESLLVVADGVGGWTELGINPAYYTRDLVHGIYEEHQNDPAASPLELLKRRVDISATKFEGSCTCTIIKIESPTRISTATIGDAGYALFHVNSNGKLEMYYRSPEQ
jgi:protein phosphatase PTC7